MRKTVLFYMQVPFLDVNLELLKVIKSHYDVHVLIELPPSHLHANILSLDIDLNVYQSITPFQEVATAWKLDYLTEYFQGCTAVDFAVYKPAKSLKTFYSTTRDIIRHINSRTFDYYHFDDFSARQAFVLPFIRPKKGLILNIHDPVPHKGEFEWKRFLIRKIFYGRAASFITFSNFSKWELAKRVAPERPIRVLNLLPYTVFRQFQEEKGAILAEDGSISFFGRLSPYKGIDILLEAIEEVLREFPDQKFFIGGRPIFGYAPDFGRLGKHSASVRVLQRHLTNQEITGVIAKSKLVVCPYREATQSGVVMTSFALHCPVLVTNTGGLAESVRDNVTGLVAHDLSGAGIAAKIREFLRNDLSAGLRANLKGNSGYLELAKANSEVIKTVYN